MLREVLVVMRKELLDFSRDRRTIKSMAALLLGFPLLYIVLIGVISSQVQEQMERTIQVGVVGCPHAAELCDFLRENRTDLVPMEKPDTDVIAARKLDIVLIISDDFQATLVSHQKTKITYWYDEVEEKSEYAERRLHGLLDAYNSTLGYRRALLRGVDPSTLKPLEIDDRTIKPKKGLGFGAVQLFISCLMMACFMGTYHLAVDSVAGEKERHTLESLMQTASSRTSLMIGKFLAVASVGVVGVTASALIFKFLVGAAPLQRFMGSTVELSWIFVGQSLIIVFPLLLVATSLQFMIGSLTRSVKEAQAYTSALSIIGFLPASFASVLEKLSSAVWLPNLGQSLALLRLGKEQPVNWLACLCASSGTLLLALLFMLVVYRAFHSEKIFRSGT